MNETIFYVGGSKGGVGKSQCCFALLDYLLDSGKKVLLLETDTEPFCKFADPAQPFTGIDDIADAVYPAV